MSRRIFENFQIFGPVIKRIPIDMMDNFAFTKLSAKRLFRGQNRSPYITSRVGKWMRGTIYKNAISASSHSSFPAGCKRPCFVGNYFCIASSWDSSQMQKAPYPIRVAIVFSTKNQNAIQRAGQVIGNYLRFLFGSKRSATMHEEFCAVGISELNFSSQENTSHHCIRALIKFGYYTDAFLWIALIQSRHFLFDLISKFPLHFRLFFRSNQWA